MILMATEILMWSLMEMILADRRGRHPRQASDIGVSRPRNIAYTRRIFSGTGHASWWHDVPTSVDWLAL